MRQTRAHNLLEFGERLDLVLWETCHIYATCQAYRAEADFQQTGNTDDSGYESLGKKRLGKRRIMKKGTALASRVGEGYWDIEQRGDLPRLMHANFVNCAGIVVGIACGR